MNRLLLSSLAWGSRRTFTLFGPFRGVKLTFTSAALAFAFTPARASTRTMAGWLPTVGSFAIPAVSLLIFFLSYTSQYLFYYLQPGPLSRGEALLFNGCVLAIWWCYDQACTVDPGRKGWVHKVTANGDKSEGNGPKLEKGMRWCKKCEAVKPPRAHHCRQCGRYGSSRPDRYAAC